ncbi:MAG: transcriptional repressor [Acidimicrobiaceae bacterium]|nr:transcriptional repressor [Acidimicrobiaceae bacterium]
MVRPARSSTAPESAGERPAEVASRDVPAPAPETGSPAPEGTSQAPAREQAAPATALEGESEGVESAHGAPAGVEDVVSMLRARGGRVTATRRVTIDVLLAGGDHRHLSADEVAGEVRKRLPDVAESTIYRTLTALEELGVVTHVHLGHGPSTFHLADQGHRHLVCQSCESVTEVPAWEFAALAQRLDEVYGFAMSSEHFAIVGRCRKCRDLPPTD